MNRTILITGATSGIGQACAEVFAADGDRLLLNGRREDRLQQLQEELSGKYKVDIHLLPFDVREKEIVFDALHNLPEEWRSIDVLINNAGLALGRQHFDEAHIHDWETMIDTNLKGLLYVTKAVLPEMVSNKKGHIINIGSTAGDDVYENGNIYCATKSAVDAVSQAMRIDLLSHHIKVTLITPGAVETEFALVRFKGDEEKAAATYQGFKPLTGKDVANAVFYSASLPPEVCINKLIITPTAQANGLYIYKGGK